MISLVQNQTQLYRLILHTQGQKWAKALQSGGEVKYPHQPEPLPKALVLDHLEGKITLGVMLLQPGINAAKAGCIDIDCPRDAATLQQGLELAKKLQSIASDAREAREAREVREVREARDCVLAAAQTEHPVGAFLEHRQLHSYIEFSGNRGWHLWLFSAAPLPGDTWIKALNNLAAAAGFTAKEVFPNHPSQESKCIKLPGAVHLKSGRRAGFIPVSNQNLKLDPEGFPILPENQAELMAGFIQNAPEDIAALAALGNSPKTAANHAEGTNTLKDNSSRLKTHFQGDKYPGCIQHLITNGAPLDLDYNNVNLTLSRYAIARGMTESAALELAYAVSINTSEAHPTSKDEKGRVANFQSALRTARRKGYHWECSYALAGIDTRNQEALKARGCSGENCPAWQYHHKPFTGDYKPFSGDKKPLNAAIWQALQNLSSTGMEVRVSTILAELEKLDLDQFSVSNRFVSNYNTTNTTEADKSSVSNCNTTEADKSSVSNCNVTEAGNLSVSNCNTAEADNLSVSNWNATEADTLAEWEVLAYLLQNPEELGEALSLDIAPEGFISRSSEALPQYLEKLFKADIPQPQTFIAHLSRIRDTGLRVVAGMRVTEADLKFADRTAPVADSLDKLITGTQNLLRRTSSDIQPMQAYTKDLMLDLFSKPEAAIATPSQWLNNALNGGFAPSKLYVIGAPPAAGKSTFCNWCGDFAAANGIPVLVASYEMGKYQLWAYSLARISGINSALIEGKRWNDESYEARDTLLSRVTQAAQDYHQSIAPNLTILECGAEHTAARLKGAISQIRYNAGLDKDAPVLVIVDYLQLMLSGDDKLDSSAAETLRVSRIAIALKQLARDTKAAVIAISDITKAAYQQALSTGSLDMSALRDSFKIAHAADVIALLQTGKITLGRGDNAQTLDQLAIAAHKYPEKQRLIEQARVKYPLSESSRDTYARLSILKNRGGMLADPLFIYHKALHKFTQLDLDLGGNDDADAI